VSTSAHTQRAYTPCYTPSWSITWSQQDNCQREKPVQHNRTCVHFTSLLNAQMHDSIVRSLASNLFSFHIRCRTTLRDSFALCMHSIVTTCSSSSDRCRAVHGLCTCRLVSAVSLIDGRRIAINCMDSPFIPRGPDAYFYQPPRFLTLKLERYSTTVYFPGYSTHFPHSTFRIPSGSVYLSHVQWI
jgi:hypothetical protein